MKKVKRGNVVLCEYIALGSFAKHTLVNVYAGDILLKEYPGTLPLSFFIELLPDEEMPQQITFEVKQGSSTKAELKAEFDHQPSRSALIVIPQLPYTFHEDTDLTVTATGKGLKSTVLIRKKISLGPIPAG